MPRAAVYEIVAIVAGEDVAAPEPVDVVITSLALEVVSSFVADERVLAGRAFDVLDAGEPIETCAAGPTRIEANDDLVAREPDCIRSRAPIQEVVSRI